MSTSGIDLDGHHEETAQPALFANRLKVYPKAVKGPVRRIKWALLVVMLGIYYILPWVRWDRGPGRPDQALLLDMEGRRGYFFNLEIWPDEIYYLAGLLILAAVLLFLVTSLYGRLWCGYACPQTVWTDLFMWVERLIEGDRAERIRNDKAKLTVRKAWRKVAKHTVWLVIAALTGGAWIMYFRDAPTVTVELLTGSASGMAYSMFALFTITTYVLAGWAREQVCTYMCPWPRFQAAMLDDQTVTVTYQGWRGETRGKYRKGESFEGRGDCVDCAQCVQVCPTGIDIRDGIQLECINCGLCVDACDNVMEKLHRPKSLITWDTFANQAALGRGETPKPMKLIRPRTMIYTGLIVVLGAVMLTQLLTRTRVDTTLIRDRAPLFVTLSDGSIRNGYTLKITNRRVEPASFAVMVDGPEGLKATVHLADGQELPADDVEVRGDGVGSLRMFVSMPRAVIPEEQTPLHVTVRNQTTGEEAHVDTMFVAPPSGGDRTQRTNSVAPVQMP
ncbi:cytochrome c oxidase accessory protein CcoG [Tistrella bauzanensis]|jgi:cytochrome c oxidase accessory protein FixG|uniref:cytochrome c oxidase accessory protein CcoG n=1 Tax=Tistrella TaxID=171436 RepID=UPI0031F6B3E4